MLGRNINQFGQLLNNTEHYSITPSCLDIILMLPFPFFCSGCCVSKTTRLIFDKTTHLIHITTYHGYCCCCYDTYQVQF